MWPTEASWRSSVPELVARASHRWGLTVGDPIAGGSASHIARVTTAEGEEAILKISLPHREALGEADALRWWDGRGAVRLTRHDPDAPFRLLLEYCRPGTPLKDRDDLTPDERLEIAGGLVARLWDHGIPDDFPFEAMSDVTAEWADLLEQRMQQLRPPFDRGLVRRGAGLLRELPASAPRRVVVHGDLNPGNVLASSREPWLVIDPKPLVGDPGYDLCPLLMQVDDPFDHPDTSSVLRSRVGLLADITGVEFPRIVAWCVAREVEAALWYVSRSEVEAGTRVMERIPVTAGLLE